MIVANILLIINLSWVENKKACDRLIELWPNIEAMIKFWNKLPKSKQPSSKSYMEVKDRVDDKLITAKLSFFNCVASIVEPFLKKYQCDKPMIPFMYTDLKSLIQSLLELVVKQDVLSQCKTGIIFIFRRTNKIKAGNEEARRAVYLSTDIKKIKVKCDRFKKAISMMESEFVDCITRAEMKNDMSYVIKGNALKR